MAIPYDPYYADAPGRNDWRLIETAPAGVALIVTNATHWTLARRAYIPCSTLRWGWPLISSEHKWVWVFANTNAVPIDFEPTHWQPGPKAPPRDVPPRDYTPRLVA